MMYMDDAIRATLELMGAPAESLGDARGGYNIAGASFSVAELVASIQRHLPDFTCTYAPDERQAYADSWPDEVEDDIARSEWGWNPAFDLDATVDAMFAGLASGESP
jgi:nucleoside-diphosphate-sugar epimerase